MVSYEQVVSDLHGADCALHDRVWVVVYPWSDDENGFGAIPLGVGFAIIFLIARSIWCSRRLWLTRVAWCPPTTWLTRMYWCSILHNGSLLFHWYPYRMVARYQTMMLSGVVARSYILMLSLFMARSLPVGALR